MRISVEVLAFGPFPQFGGEVADREPGPGLPFKSHWKKNEKNFDVILYVCYIIICILYIYMCVCYDYTLYVYMCVC